MQDAYGYLENHNSLPTHVMIYIFNIGFHILHIKTSLSKLFLGGSCSAVFISSFLGFTSITSSDLSLQQQNT